VKELILGGVRSGKSALAQQRALASGLHLTFIATATAEDEAMAARIQRHRLERTDAWTLIEEPIVLVDCLTLWLSNLLGAASESAFQYERQALLELLPQLPGHIILVSNEVNMGVVPMGELSRRFCDEAGWLHQALAQQCQRVTLSVAGLPLVLKGESV
jgi:adenosylcobinamide kinase/adenosylcobinamide-phosphate guanylyltransferase